MKKFNLILYSDKKKATKGYRLEIAPNGDISPVSAFMVDFGKEFDLALKTSELSQAKFLGDFRSNWNMFTPNREWLCIEFLEVK